MLVVAAVEQTIHLDLVVLVVKVVVVLEDRLILLLTQQQMQLQALGEEVVEVAETLLEQYPVLVVLVLL
jgi:ribosomal silencing factor RsfS